MSIPTRTHKVAQETWMGSHVQMLQQHEAVYGVALLPKIRTVLIDSIRYPEQGQFNYRNNSDHTLSTVWLLILLP